MIIKATQKNTRQTALKVRLVANQVRKLSLADAIQQLAVMQKRASLVVLKVLRQAVADAVHNHGYTIDDLKLKNITVAPGPTYKRFRAVSRGRAHTIFKRTCHISVELEAGGVPKTDNKKVKKVATESKVEVKTQDQKTTEKAQQSMTAIKKVAPSTVVAKKVTKTVRKSGKK